MQCYLAFYKYKRPIKNFKDLWYRICDEAIRYFTKGKYSHCEIVIKSGKTYLCYSSSIRDGGVRSKFMPLPIDRWNLVPVKLSKRRLDEFYNKTQGKKYDLIGALGVKIPFLKQNKNKYFCSEWCAELLNIENAHKVSPNDLFRLPH